MKALSLSFSCRQVRPDYKGRDMRFIQSCQLACVLAFGAVTAVAVAQPVKLGAATYYLSPRGKDKPPPVAPYRTEALLKQAAPTNQWYSSLIFNPQPEALFAHPNTYKTTSAGFEMALASKQVVPTERRDVEIHYTHREPLVFSPVAFASGQAKLAKASDWAIDIAMDQGADQMMVTVAHASPYAYFKLSRGEGALHRDFDIVPLLVQAGVNHADQAFVIAVRHQQQATARR